MHLKTFAKYLLKLDDKWSLIFVFVIAAITVLTLYVPVDTPDTARFKEQADSIVSGHGYRTLGTLETWLPPGYPVLIAATNYLGGGDLTVRTIQIVLFISACGLLYLALRPASRAIALLGATAMAIHPLAARLVGYQLSETFGLFLCGAFIFAFSRINDGNKLLLLLFGACSVFLPLTSPATIILCIFLFGYVVLRKLTDNKVVDITFLIAGAFVVMLPWQVHCVGDDCE